jgi:TRAP-type C4-dicarboxylate transport system permease small subunit
MRLRKTIDSTIGYALIALMSAMVLNVLWQVFTRFILTSPSSFTDELARYLMIWLSMLGAAYVSGQNTHVSIDVFTLKYKASTQLKIKKFTFVLIILFAFFVMIVGGIRLVYISFILGQNSPALQLPLGLVYAIIPISGTLIIYYKIVDLISA